MGAPDASMHGLLLGPVPIVLGVWSLVEFVKILVKSKRVTHSNALSVYGLSPLVVILGCFAIGVVAREDLSVRILAAGSVVSGILALVLHGVIWRSIGAPDLDAWFATGKLSTKSLLKRVLISLLLLSGFFIPLYLFGLGRAECTTGPCRAAAILIGSNLGAGGLMWLVFIVCGFVVSALIASALELASRAVAKNDT